LSWRKKFHFIFYLIRPTTIHNINSTTKPPKLNKPQEIYLDFWVNFLLFVIQTCHSQTISSIKSICFNDSTLLRFLMLLFSPFFFYSYSEFNISSKNWKMISIHESSVFGFLSSSFFWIEVNESKRETRKRRKKYIR
jgi:hypothetical protein